MRSSLHWTVILACCATVSAQTVWTVDISGGGDFVDLQSAVAAAAPGDTVLMQPGNYSAGVSIDIDKSLRVVADGAGVMVQAAITVRDLGPTDSLYLGGINDSDPPELMFLGGLAITNCAGNVWIESFSATSIIGDPLVITDSASVVLTNCALAAISDPGLVAVRSTVHAFDSTLVGGPVGASDGGAGAQLEDSQLYATNCTVIGGEGFAGGPFGPPGDGGPGIDLRNGSTAFLRGGSLVAGPGGFDVFTGAMGQPGPASFVDGTSTLTTTAGPVHTLSVPLLVREGQALNYEIAGPPGDITALTFAPTPAPLFFDLANGSLLLGGGFFSIAIGAIPANGMQTIATTLNDLGPGNDVRAFFVQVLALDVTAPAAYAGSGAVLTLLDAAF